MSDKGPRYPLNKRPVVLQGRAELFARDKMLLSLPKIKQRGPLLPQYRLSRRGCTVLLVKKDVNSKGLPGQAEVAQGVPGRLMPRIFFDVSALQGW